MNRLGKENQEKIKPTPLYRLRTPTLMNQPQLDQKEYQFNYIVDYEVQKTSEKPAWLRDHNLKSMESTHEERKVWNARRWKTI